MECGNCSSIFIIIRSVHYSDHLKVEISCWRGLSKFLLIEPGFTIWSLWQFLCFVGEERVHDPSESLPGEIAHSKFIHKKCYKSNFTRFHCFAPCSYSISKWVLSVLKPDLLLHKNMVPLEFSRVSSALKPESGT